jgi:hypothetical protein
MAAETVWAGRTRRTRARPGAGRPAPGGPGHLTSTYQPPAT